MSDLSRFHQPPEVSGRLVLTAGIGASLVFAMYFACPPQLGQRAPAVQPASEEQAVSLEIAPAPPRVPARTEQTTVPPAPAQAADSAHGWPKPGDPLIVPQGTVSPSGAPAVPIVRFDAPGCAACLSDVCSAELAAGGNLDDALHMIGCTRLADEPLCVRGAEPNRLTRMPIPPLPSGELTDATRALIACAASCRCWTESAAP